MRSGGQACTEYSLVLYKAEKAKGMNLVRATVVGRELSILGHRVLGLRRRKDTSGRLLNRCETSEVRSVANGRAGI
jgi:hypothetical protein